MPIPVSRTSRRSLPSRSPTDIETRPPSGVNLIAFASRFQMTCCSRAGSQRIARGSLHGWTSSRIRLASAVGRRASTDRLHHVRDRRLAHVEPELSRDDAGGVEQILDEAGLQPRVALDDFDGARGGGGVERSGRQQPGPAEDRVERRAQLVRERREKLVFRPVCGLRLLACGPLPFERFLARLVGPGHRDGVAHASRDAVGAERLLREIVDRAGAHQLHRQLLVPLTRQHDDGRGDARGADRAQDLQAVGPRQQIVDEDALVLALDRQADPVGRGRRLVERRRQPRPDERARDRPPVDGVIVDDEKPHVHHGNSTSVQYLLSVAISSAKSPNVTGFTR